MTSSGSAVVTLPADKQILITREFDAPRDLVWRAWTDNAEIVKWWGPHQALVGRQAGQGHERRGRSAGRR